MNSNSCKNEILADARMKSANADEIFGFASDEIKSTHSPSRRISSNKVGFHCRRRFHPPARVDLVENDKFLSKLVVFWSRWQGAGVRWTPLRSRSTDRGGSRDLEPAKCPLAVPEKILTLERLIFSTAAPFCTHCIRHRRRSCSKLPNWATPR